MKRVYRLYVEEDLAVRRRKRKRPVRDRALEPRLIRPNQEWAMDFIIDGRTPPSCRAIKALLSLC